MIHHLPEQQRESTSANSAPRQASRRLQLVLWTLWTLAVASGGYLGWRADTLAGRPMNLLGMAITASMVGVIGLIVLTLIETHLEPWRFLDER